MAIAIIIVAQTDASQTSLTITDKTAWTSTDYTIASLNSLVVNIYSSSLIDPEYIYTLSASELTYFKLNGTITLSFTQMFGNLYLSDGFYNARTTANSGEFISNFYGFGIYVDITYAVTNMINSLDSAESIKFDAEKYATQMMFLEGLKYLDTTTINNRDIKFNKRLKALNRVILDL